MVGVWRDPNGILLLLLEGGPGAREGIVPQTFGRNKSISFVHRPIPWPRGPDVCLGGARGPARLPWLGGLWRRKARGAEHMSMPPRPRPPSLQVPLLNFLQFCVGSKLIAKESFELTLEGARWNSSQKQIPWSSFVTECGSGVRWLETQEDAGSAFTAQTWEKWAFETVPVPLWSRLDSGRPCPPTQYLVLCGLPCARPAHGGAPGLGSGVGSRATCLVPAGTIQPCPRSAVCLPPWLAVTCCLWAQPGSLCSCPPSTPPSGWCPRMTHRCLSPPVSSALSFPRPGPVPGAGALPAEALVWPGRGRPAIPGAAVFVCAL